MIFINFFQNLLNKKIKTSKTLFFNIQIKFSHCRYALVNLLLVIGAKKEIKILVLVWIAFTIGFLIWSFVLVSIMFGYDTTPGFVAGVGIAQLFNFIIMIRYLKIFIQKRI